MRGLCAFVGDWRTACHQRRFRIQLAIAKAGQPYLVSTCLSEETEGSPGGKVTVPLARISLLFPLLAIACSFGLVISGQSEGDTPRELCRAIRASLETGYHVRQKVELSSRENKDKREQASPDWARPVARYNDRQSSTVRELFLQRRRGPSGWSRQSDFYVSIDSGAVHFGVTESSKRSCCKGLPPPLWRIPGPALGVRDTEHSEVL